MRRARRTRRFGARKSASSVDDEGVYPNLIPLITRMRKEGISLRRPS